MNTNRRLAIAIALLGQTLIACGSSNGRACGVARDGEAERAHAQRAGVQLRYRGPRGHSATRRSRKALPMTLTDESAIAAAASMGERMMPKTG